MVKFFKILTSNQLINHLSAIISKSTISSHLMHIWSKNLKKKRDKEMVRWDQLCGKWQNNKSISSTISFHHLNYFCVIIYDNPISSILILNSISQMRCHGKLVRQIRIYHLSYLISQSSISPSTMSSHNLPSYDSSHNLTSIQSWIHFHKVTW